MIIGFLAVLATMAVWWRDVIREATFEGFHTPVVQLGLRYGMALFIASEVMFFSAFFWAFFTSSPVPGRRGVAAQGHPPVRPVRVPVSQHADPAALGHDRDLGAPLAARGQPEGTGAGPDRDRAARPLPSPACRPTNTHTPRFSFKDGIYPSTFFMATGFHGFHVIVGTIFLAVCLWRATQGHFRPDHHFGPRSGGVGTGTSSTSSGFSMFVCIYWWGNGRRRPCRTRRLTERRSAGFIFRHPRESGGPGASDGAAVLDSAYAEMTIPS
jgi:cytochrome c oxidase subunit 3